MKIQSVQLIHRNPSMGPQEVTVSYWISLADKPEISAKLLRETRLNDTVSLEDYCRAVLAKDTPILKKVEAQAPKPRLAEGSIMSDLNFALDGGKSVNLADLRTWEIQGYYPDTFQKMLVEKGSRSQSPAAPLTRPGPVPIQGDGAIRVLHKGDVPE